MAEHEYPTLYTTEARNSAEYMSHTYIPNDLDLAVSPPNNPAVGTNAEQLLAMTVATCINGTLQAIEDKEGLPHTAETRTTVDMTRDVHGIQFFVHTRVRVPLEDRHHAEAIATLAEKRCPISKLIQGNPNVSFELVDEF